MVSAAFGRKWAATRTRILARDKGVCWICGMDGARSVDHIVPRAYGGGHDDANLAAAHMKCNSKRGGHMKGPKSGLPRANASRWG